MNDDHYATLGINATATQKEIAKAFRAKARVLHPDKQPPGTSTAGLQTAKKAFQELIKAYEVLNDPAKRAKYDLTQPLGKDSAAAAAEHRQNRETARDKRRQDARGGRRRANNSNDEYGPGEGETGTRPGASTRPQGKRLSRPSRPPTAAEDEEKRKLRERLDEEWRQEQQRMAAERRAQDQRDYETKIRKEGLGSHWVEPPDFHKNDASEPWKGWNPDDEKEDDEISKASSILSFEIKIDLNSLNLDEGRIINDDPGEQLLGECWQINREPAAEAAEETREDCQAVPTDCAPDASVNKSAPKQPHCCIVQ